MSSFKSPLHETVMTTPTQVWNDSCSFEELKYAIEHGAVGATTNPVIVGEVLKKEMHLWKDRINELIKTMPKATEIDIAWKLIEEMAVKGAEFLLPVFEKEKGLKGRLSIQTNAQYYRDAEKMSEQAQYFNTLAPNMQVKMPVTKAGIAAIEDATYHGVCINATVSFTVPQSLAVGEAIEKGLKRREAEGKDVSRMNPVCTLMVGRLDDWLKASADKAGILANPACYEWAGVAAIKKAYNIFRQRGYRTKMLSAAYRNHFHWSELVGGDLVLTIPGKWQKRINASGIPVIKTKIDEPVPADMLKELTTRLPEFNRAYDENGLKPEEFETYGATARTLRQFLNGYADLLSVIRDFMVPNPDK
ncbi:MAG: transaldolase [Spirochaetales bacterium]|nr:MAG: transaldolase [Spirochaetales bacterium]